MRVVEERSDDEILNRLDATESEPVDPFESIACPSCPRRHRRGDHSRSDTDRHEPARRQTEEQSGEQDIGAVEEEDRAGPREIEDVADQIEQQATARES